MINWRNNYTLKSNSPITAIDTYYDEKTGTFLMCIGDDKGTIRVQDISAIIKQDLVPIEPVVMGKSSTQRNPYREFDTRTIVHVGNGSSSEITNDKELGSRKNCLVKEHEILQIS